jgi:hypothetical protein
VELAGGPDFLHAAQDSAACAPFCKERRMKSGNAIKLHRKSAVGEVHAAFLNESHTRGRVQCSVQEIRAVHAVILIFRRPEALQFLTCSAGLTSTSIRS